MLHQLPGDFKFFVVENFFDKFTFDGIWMEGQTAENKVHFQISADYIQWG